MFAFCARKISMVRLDDIGVPVRCVPGLPARLQQPRKLGVAKGHVRGIGVGPRIDAHALHTVPGEGGGLDARNSCLTPPRFHVAQTV